MNTSIDCIPCFVRQTLDAARISSDDPIVHEQIIRDVLRWLSQMDMSLSPPALAQRIHRRLRELTGVADPYRKQKDQHNQMALQLLPGLRTQVEKSNDPLQMYLADIYTLSTNLAGLPAMSVPCGFSQDLPIGMQLIGNYFSEARLLQVAHQYQQATDWHLRQPSEVL